MRRVQPDPHEQYCFHEQPARCLLCSVAFLQLSARPPASNETAMHRVNQTAQHVIGAGSTTDIRTGECARERVVLRVCEGIECVRARLCAAETMEIVAEQRTSDHPMIINGELVQGSTGLSDPVCVAPSLNQSFPHTKTERSSWRGR